MKRFTLLVVSFSILASTTPLRAQTEILERGRRLFDMQCVRCHGVGATGGEGPTLLGRQFRTATDAAGIIPIITGGIPGTGMPGSWLSDTEAEALAAYVWSVARVEAEDVPGDAVRGRELFGGKGACATCHIVRGEGVGLGPDLTSVGARRGASYLRESILAPGAKLPAGLRGPHSSFLIVSVTTGDGEQVEGMRVNEDAFALNLRDASGRYHSLRKRDLQSMERRFGTSLMPDYSELLTGEELTDLVAYLVSLRGA